MSYLSILVLFLAFITFTTNIAIVLDPRNEIYESAPPSGLINPPTIIVPKKPAPPDIPLNPPFTPPIPHIWPGTPRGLVVHPFPPPDYYANRREGGN